MAAGRQALWFSRSQYVNLPKMVKNDGGATPLICLNAIAGDEEHCIRRMLESVKPFIGYWVISCNGTDNTQEIIRDVLSDIPGELMERPWVNYAHNRTEALVQGRGKAQYHMIIDCDETFEREMPFKDLDLPHYTCNAVNTDGSPFTRQLLLRDDCNWRYESAAHNYPICESATPESPLAGGMVYGKLTHYADGFTWADNKQKNLDKAHLLEEAVKDTDRDEHKIHRDYFYMGECYFMAGDIEKAVEVHEKRMNMGGWEEERWTSQLRVASLTADMSKLLACFEARPQRPEPLFYIGESMRAQGHKELAGMFYTATQNIIDKYPDCEDIVRHDTSIRDGKLAAAVIELSPLEVAA